MLKVLIVSVGKLSGGVESYTLILGKMLADKGVEVHYAIRKGAWLDSQLTNVRKIVVELGRNSLSDMKKLREYVEVYKINIIHCNSNNGLFVSQLIKENSECKKICVIHGDVKIDQNHKGCIISTLYEKLETWLLKKRCSHCIAVSESIKEILIDRGINKNRITVIYNGIVPFIYDKYPNYYADELKIVTVGNLLPVKNQIVLLQALYIISNKYPEIRYKCDIFGEGPERGNLEKFISEKALINIHLKGFDKQVREKLNEYQIYIHTSKYESFGIAIVEAMNAGCCVITSDVGGVKEIIAQDSGFIVASDDAEAIADYIYYCYKNRDVLMKIAKNGKRRSEIEFTSDVMIDHVMKIYRKLI